MKLEVHGIKRTKKREIYETLIFMTQNLKIRRSIIEQKYLKICQFPHSRIYKSQKLWIFRFV